METLTDEELHALKGNLKNQGYTIVDAVADANDNIIRHFEIEGPLTDDAEQVITKTLEDARFVGISVKYIAEPTTIYELSQPEKFTPYFAVGTGVKINIIN